MAKSSLAAALEAARRGGIPFDYLTKGDRFHFATDRAKRLYEKRSGRKFIEVGTSTPVFETGFSSTVIKVVAS